MEDLNVIVQPLLYWYERNARILPWRSRPTPYRVLISEIMLQQTRVEAVKPYYDRFLKALPTISALAAVEDEALMKLWEGLGYYGRARNLKRCAQLITNEYGGQMPASYERLLTLPGIGPYTAGAIASIAFGIPVPAVDGNVLRVLSRVTADGRSVSDPRVKHSYEQRLAGVIPPDRAGDFNQSLMELGAVVCLPGGAPRCGECPLDTLCAAKKLGRQQSYPVKEAKKPRRTELRTVLLLINGDRVALRRRPERGLLAGMYEFPCLEGKCTAAQALEGIAALGLAAGPATPLPSAKHIFTHLEWHMAGFWAQVLPQTDTGLIWATREELAGQYAVPGAYRAYLACLPRLLQNRQGDCHG